jgi:hypothetical protein
MSKVINFNQNKGFNVSERYVPINTEMVVNSFEAAGYQINKVKSSSVRDPLKDGYQKHLIRMSHPDTSLKIEGLTPEIILKNSFDGSSSFRLNIGVYRLICSNGLEVGTTFTSERVRHVGKDVLFQVLQAAERIKLGLPQLANEIEVMRGYQMSQYEALELANMLGENVLLKGKSNVISTNFNKLLYARRPGDKPHDAFTVMNVIQENALKGFYSYQTETPYLPGVKDPQMKIQTKTGRAVRSIDKTSDINRSIWDFTLDLIGA